MNWGTKIIIVYVAFIAGILFMVFKSSNQKTDLVTTNYYEKELTYQEKIDQMNRVVALSAPLIYVIEGNDLIISFPNDFAGKKLTGEAVLYCPSDENKDLKNNFSLQDEPLRIRIPAKNKGLHELQINWADGSTTYYFEKKIFI